MRDEYLNGEIFYSLKEEQIVIEGWRKEYNTVRPHSALGYRPPALGSYKPRLLPKTHFTATSCVVNSLAVLGTKNRFGQGQN